MKFILSTTITFLIVSVGMSQGIIFDSLSYQKIQEFDLTQQQGYASSTSLPSKLSYRSYCPPVLNQGQLSTCVGWASAYAQVSTQQNILMGETNFRRKSVRAMDPNFIYAMIRNYDDRWCQGGTLLLEAMIVLKDYGVKPYLSVPWLKCNAVSEFDDFTLKLASMYSIESYYALQDKSDLVNTLKAILNYKKVVSIGILVTESFEKASGAKWSPQYNEKIIGGHAMCIIGYDDNKFGGSFEVMNSYGTEYGDNGFIWITYADMKKYLQEAFIVDIPEGEYGFRKGDCTYGDCNNYYSRYKYTDGTLYEGQFAKGYPQGWGNILRPDGSLYIGNFTKGSYDGFGILFDPKTGNYYKVKSDMGTLISSKIFQGFAGSEEDSKLDEIISAMQLLIPGEVVLTDDEAYDELIERFVSFELEQVRKE